MRAAGGRKYPLAVPGTLFILTKYTFTFYNEGLNTATVRVSPTPGLHRVVYAPAMKEAFYESCRGQRPDI